MNKKALEQLAKSSYWKVVRDEFFKTRVQELTYSKKVNSELPADEFKIEILSRQKACEIIEAIISEIDVYGIELRESINTNQYK